MTEAGAAVGHEVHPELVAELRKSVHAALVGKSKGTSTAAYTNLVRDLCLLKRRLDADPCDSEAEFSLAQLLRALTGCVSSLRERRHDALLGEVLSIRPWLAPREARVALLEVLVNLMVANGAFLHNCLQAMVIGLLPPLTAVQPDEPGADWRPSEHALEVQGHVLDAIEKALQLVPTLPSQLLPMLLSNLPHKARDRPTQCLYLRAALALAERPAGAALREGLLLGVVDHLLSLDVEIKWEDIVDVKTGQEQEEGSSEEEEDHEDIFELEGMQELDIHGVPIPAGAGHQAARPPALRGGWEGGAGAGEAAASGVEGGEGGEGAAGRPPVDEAVDKLDSMMELVLEHLGRRCAAGQLTQVWHTLLAAFERSLLHTHRSKFTQYLLLRAAAEDPAHCCPSFASALLARLRDARQPPITRAAAAAYLASFLARCALAPEALVVEVLQQLAGACAEYAGAAGGAGAHGASGASAGGPKAGVVTLAANGNGNGLPPAGPGAADAAAAAAARHQVFYAMVQALLYVLCYHMEPLVRQQRHHPGASPAHAAAVKALVRDRVAPLLRHPRLAPLGACLPSVSAEFVRQAAALKIADLTDVLPQPGAAGAANGGAAGGRSSGSGVTAAVARPAVRPLEMFFPFDPYLLRRSARLLALERTYVAWRGGHPCAGAAGDESDDEAAGAAGAAAGASDDGGADDSGAGSSSSSDDDSGDEDSSSDLDEDADHHMAASLDGPDGMTPPGMLGAAAAAGGGGAAAMHRAASIGGLRPVGVAAAAAAAAARREQARRLAAAGLSLSGPSPDAMMLGTSVLSSEGFGHSYGAGGGPGGAAGASPGGAPPALVFGGVAAASPGSGTPLGASPAPMSYMSYDNSYMHHIPAHLNTHA